MFVYDQCSHVELHTLHREGMWNIPDPDSSIYTLTAPVSFTQDVNDLPLYILVHFIWIFSPW